MTTIWQNLSFLKQDLEGLSKIKMFFPLFVGFVESLFGFRVRVI